MEDNKKFVLETSKSLEPETSSETSPEILERERRINTFFDIQVKPLFKSFLKRCRGHKGLAISMACTKLMDLTMDILVADFQQADPEKRRDFIIESRQWYVMLSKTIVDHLGDEGITRYFSSSLMYALISLMKDAVISEIDQRARIEIWNEELKRGVRGVPPTIEMLFTGFLQYDEDEGGEETAKKA